LEERALADSDDDSDRFAGTQADTLTSLVAAANMAGKAMGERDHARLALVAMTAERDVARSNLARLAGDLEAKLHDANNTIRALVAPDESPHSAAKYWRERQAARAEVEDLTLDLEVANATIERVTLVGSEHPHADTCAMELSPNEDYECSCWRSALEAALVPHAD
jgi:hypothetical protein